MFMGVPYIPFFIGAGGVLLLAMYSGNFILLMLLPVVIYIMRMMARRDELIFRMLGLRLMVRLRMRNLDLHDGLWVFNPNPYRTKPSPAHTR